MSLFAENVPENHRILVRLILQSHALGSRHQGIFRLARRGDPREIAFDIGGKDRNPRFGQPLRENLKRDGLAGAGGAGNQPMAIGKMKIEHFVLRALADDNRVGLGRIVDHRAGAGARPDFADFAIVSPTRISLFSGSLTWPGEAAATGPLGLAAKRQTTERLECPEIEKSHLNPGRRLDRQCELFIVHGAGNDARAIRPRRARIKAGCALPSIRKKR